MFYNFMLPGDKLGTTQQALLLLCALRITRKTRSDSMHNLHIIYSNFHPAGNPLHSVHISEKQQTEGLCTPWCSTGWC